MTRRFARSLGTIGLAALSLATASMAVAQPAPPPAPPPAGAGAPGGWTPHDIPFAEFQQRANAWWDRMDANHDGKIDSADRDARALERFAKMDTNHDGSVSRDEFLAYLHGQPQGAPVTLDGESGAEAAPPPPQPGAGRPHWGGGGAMLVEPIRQAVAQALATSPDHSVSRTTFDAAVKAEFDKLDANHDGVLTRDELRAAFMARMPGMRGADGRRDWLHGAGENGGMGAGGPPPGMPPMPGGGE